MKGAIFTEKNYPQACEVPIEERVSHLSKRQDKAIETQDAILSYLEHTFGRELVRVISTSRLRLAKKEEQ